MPLYDYECECGKRVVDVHAPYEGRDLSSTCCPMLRMHRLVASCKIETFQEGRYEELGDDSPYITSKAHLAEECRKRGLASRQLMEGYNSRAQKRWI